MDTVEKIITFLNSYPSWAKLLALLGLVTTSSVLLFAQRKVLKAGDTASAATSAVPAENASIFLRLKRIKLFPADPDAEVQLLVHVNGTAYHHPSIGGVEWMKVGPGMSEKLIELPRFDYYVISIEMNRKGKPSLGSGRTLQYVEPSRRATSQLASTIMQLPFEEEYKLYDVEGKTRSAAVSASVVYRISRGP